MVERAKGVLATHLWKPWRYIKDLGLCLREHSSQTRAVFGSPARCSSLSVHMHIRRFTGLTPKHRSNLMLTCLAKLAMSSFAQEQLGGTALDASQHPSGKSGGRARCIPRYRSGRIWLLNRKYSLVNRYIHRTILLIPTKCRCHFWVQVGCAKNSCKSTSQRCSKR
jgi:hypothetical protein